jgi:peptidoglycan/xylan/chitin deacetylase (PgdA/CDA1 family)
VEISGYKKGKVNQGLIVFVGLIILIGSVFTYLFILRGVFGKFNTASLLPDLKLVRGVVMGGEVKIGILYSKYTENMLPQGSSWLNDNVTTWKKFLGTSKQKYDVISDETIERGKHFGYDILVLPGSRSLSDLEVTQLKKYVDNGGSIFATSGTASYSDDGKWRGWEFFSEVFGLRFTKEIESSENTHIHTLRGGLAITANIPTGFPLKVATWDRPISVEVLDPRTTQASFWYNYRLEAGLVREEIKKSAGIVFGTYGKGRFVWMGFEINSVIGVQEDYIYFDRLFRNCITWLDYGPIATIKEWPTGYDAAAVIAPTISENTEDLSNLFKVLDSERVKATFFVDANKAAQNKYIIQSAAKYGEIASLVDLGYLSSVNDTINHLNDYDTQVKKLRNAKSELEGITKSTVTGCYPYYGLFDQNSVLAVIDAKYQYIMTDSLTDRSVPKTIIRGENRIISMTKTSRDDYEIIRDFGLTLPEFQFYTYQEDIDRTLFEGGLYIMKIHPEYQCKPENVNVVKQVIQDLKRKNFWITTAAEIANWYTKKNYVEIKVDKRGESRVAVTVSNPGTQTVDQLVIQVDLNENADQVSITTEIIGTKSARIEHEKGSKTVNLFISDLKSTESRTYYLDYEKTKV